MQSQDAPLDANCPHRLLIDQVTDKWSILILTALDANPLRFNALKRRLLGVTQKALTASLRRLERNGLIGRRVVTLSPVAVEYRITPLGRTLLPPFLALYRWTVDSLPAVEKARHRFDIVGDENADAIAA
ncbi:winged helix-turn-helix transcriptional regulator [Sphingomonas bacterium]|uniref:winged helix-turn-helix transcriptional regulator n=1 Tax=Sphingomonas bacterium TaxID=1895847 RepID=UPI0015756FBD|nr:helix-turn-helix domain-containing protein [Sphingomonas bacterium]